MYKSIGIDFGTSNSSVFGSVKGTPQVIFSRFEKRSTPSVVAVNNGRISVGEIQKPDAAPDLKRIIGLSYHDSVVERYIEDTQINLEKTIDESVTVPVNGKNLRIEEVIALLFRDLTSGLNLEKIELTVITVPASFEIIRRQAIRDAAAIAGFRDVELIDETTAAAVAFAKKIKDDAHLRENRSQNPKETTLIFQLGGGTIDVAIFKITTKSVTLLGSASSCEIGGIEFERNLLKHLQKKEKLNVEDANRAEQMQLCKEAKKFLTSAMKFEKENVTINITKNDFEEASQDLLKTIGAIVDLAMDAARLEKVDEYILIGRSSQIPCVEDLIEKRLEIEKRSHIVNICEAAVKGAAICAKIIQSNSKRNLYYWKQKRSAKIDWKTETHSITIKGNQIKTTHGLNKKGAEKLLDDSLTNLPETSSIEITVRTEARGLQPNEITELKNNVDGLIKQDKELQTLEKELSDLEEE